MRRRLRFNDAYKSWRNRARRYSRESIIVGAMSSLRDAPPSSLADLSNAPWITLLMVKWVCQDRYLDGRKLPSISRTQLDDLRQYLWKFPEQIEGNRGDVTNSQLFLRQLIRPQLGFQRGLFNSFVREAALLANQPKDYRLRKLFESRTGFDVLEFVDLSLAAVGAIADERHVIPNDWFDSLIPAYSNKTVSCFRSCLGRTLGQLVIFCRSLDDAKRKVASEYFEFPVLTRYPLLLHDSFMFCWHPAVLYRGLENFVHSVLGEFGQQYMDRFSRLFERHVVTEARRVPTHFFDSRCLRDWIAADTKLPDGLVSFCGCNVFVESKAGLFDESMMSVGNTEMFAHKVKAFRNAIQQAWATSVSLRDERRAPAQVLAANVDYLLIVTNKEMAIGRGNVLKSMCPKGFLNYTSPEAARLLPLHRICLLSIDDFERLVKGAVSGINIPRLLASYVHDDRAPTGSLLLFEQHLDRRGVPQRFSDLVNTAIESSLARVEDALRCRGDL